MLIADDFFNLPSLDEFKLQLSKLRNLDLSDASIEEVQKAFLSHLPFIPRPTTYLHFEEKPNEHFFRVRLNIPQNEDLNLMRTYSYPPASACKNGRANFKGKPVFYCSNDPFTAIFESKPVAGDIGYLSVWSHSIQNSLKATLYLHESLQSNNEWQTIVKNSNQFIKEYFQQNGKDKAQHFLAVHDFLTSSFISERPPYTLTSFASYAALFGDEPSALLIYPSVAAHTRFCNIALHPNVADMFLRLDKVIRFKVVENKNPGLLLSTGRVGEVVDHIIRWRPAINSELDFNNLLNK